MIDQNKDGFITEMEFSCVCCAPFKKLDKDGDGQLSREEWNAGYDIFDIDGDGKITKAEFMSMSGMGFVFEMLDSDNDGRITQKEYMAGFDILDADHDGFLTKKVFTSNVI